MLEEPIVRKCCRCVPLRICLQVWAWFKVIADLICSLYIFAGLLLFWMTHEYDSITQDSHEYFFIALLIMMIVDLVFVAVLIAGVFMKRYLYLRIFFYYGIYMILAEAAITIALLFLVLRRSPPREWDGLGVYCTIVVLVAVTWIAIDVCIMITLKSEMVKIRNKEQYDFSRIMNTRPLPEARVYEKYVENTFEEDSRKPVENGEEKYLKLLDCN